MISSLLHHWCTRGVVSFAAELLLRRVLRFLAECSLRCRPSAVAGIAKSNCVLPHLTMLWRQWAGILFLNDCDLISRTY